MAIGCLALFGICRKTAFAFVIYFSKISHILCAILKPLCSKQSQRGFKIPAMLPKYFPNVLGQMVDSQHDGMFLYPCGDLRLRVPGQWFSWLSVSKITIRHGSVELPVWKEKFEFW
jgi:hypothetical protein